MNFASSHKSGNEEEEYNIMKDNLILHKSMSLKSEVILILRS